MLLAFFATEALLRLLQVIVIGGILGKDFIYCLQNLNRKYMLCMDLLVRNFNERKKFLKIRKRKTFFLFQVISEAVPMYEDVFECPFSLLPSWRPHSLLSVDSDRGPLATVFTKLYLFLFCLFV